MWWKQANPRPVSRAAISILGLEHHKDHHDRDQADGGHHQGKDDARWGITQSLVGTVPEEHGVDVHKSMLHQWVGPRYQQTLCHLLRTKGEAVVQAAIQKRSAELLL